MELSIEHKVELPPPVVLDRSEFGFAEVSVPIWVSQAPLRLRMRSISLHIKLCGEGHSGLK
jgi:hypothetical protein